jgi:hypothetical protein
VHFLPEVVTLSGTLTYTGEYGISAVLHGNVMDEFLDKYGLSYSGTAEESDLAALGIGFQKVDNLDTCFQYFY